MGARCPDMLSSRARRHEVGYRWEGDLCWVHSSASGRVTDCVSYIVYRGRKRIVRRCDVISYPIVPNGAQCEWRGSGPGCVLRAACSEVRDVLEY